MSSTPRSPKPRRTIARTPPHTPPHASKRQRRNRTWASIVDTLALANGIEEDKHRIAQRQKQIDYGKNTIAYDKFSAAWPRHRRQKGHPMTPLAKQRCSKRSFGGQLTSWKKKVYEFAAKLEVADTVDGGENWKVQDGEGGKEGVANKQGEGCLSRKDSMEVAEKKGAGASGKGANGREKGDKVKGVGGGDDIKRADAAESVGNGGTELGVDDELLSDMEDIELDDHGNVIEKTEIDAACGVATEGHDEREHKGEASPPSIFDAF